MNTNNVVKMRKISLLTVVFMISLLMLIPSLNAKITIVAIGDSITNGATNWSVLGHVNTIYGGWVTRLQTKLDNDSPGGCKVINKGIDGDTAQGVFNRLNSDVILLQPNIVIVAIGTNDAYGFSGVNPAAGDAVSYRIIMDKIFTEFQKNLPKIPVFVMGFTTPLKKYQDIAFVWLPAQDIMDDQFKQYNDVLKDLTTRYGYYYVDIPSKWPTDIEESWALSADGIHPNDAGYDKMTEIIYALLTSTVSVNHKHKCVAVWGQIKSF